MANVTSAAGAFGTQYKDVWAGSAQMAADSVARLDLPSGSYIENTQDDLGRLLSTVLKKADTTVLNSHAYTYNSGHQRTKQTFTAGNYTDYTYDNIGQLKTAKGKEAGGTTRLQEQFSYGYDAAWNLNKRTNNALVQAFNVNNLIALTTATNSGTLTVAGTTTSAATNVTVNTSNAVLYLDYTFAKDGFTVTNGNNTHKAIAKDSYGRSDTNTISVTLSNSVSFAYDPNGNLLTNGTRIYIYDDENQLVTNYVASAWKSEFVYDGAHRRRIRKEYTWQSSAWVLTNEVRYVYTGNLVIQERDANNLPTVRYTRSGNRLLARSDLKTISPSHAYYYMDGNGNITALVGTNQLIVAKYLYDPYGNVLSQSGPLADANVYRFASQEYHANSGLSLYLRRAYDPNLQRFVNRDPIGELGSLNLYTFVNNSPIIFGDPLGLAITYYYGNNSLFNPAGNVPYLTGDSVLENLLAGAYNTIPLLNNTLAQLLAPVNQLIDGAGDFATDVTGDSQVGDGVRNTLLAATFFCPIKVARSGTTPLWRAVNPAELSDLGANAGAFRNLSAGSEGKYFSATAEGAASYARQTFGTGLYEGPYTIVRTDIPSNLITPIMRAAPDGGIPTIVVPNGLLPRLSPGQPLPFTPLPGRP